MRKAILIVDIYDEEIPKETVAAIRFNDGDMLYTETRFIDLDEFIDKTFPIIYAKLVNGILFGDEEDE